MWFLGSSTVAEVLINQHCDGDKPHSMADRNADECRRIHAPTPAMDGWMLIVSSQEVTTVASLDLRCRTLTSQRDRVADV